MLCTIQTPQIQNLKIKPCDMEYTSKTGSQFLLLLIYIFRHCRIYTQVRFNFQPSEILITSLKLTKERKDLKDYNNS